MLTESLSSIWDKRRKHCHSFTAFVLCKLSWAVKNITHKKQLIRETPVLQMKVGYCNIFIEYNLKWTVYLHEAPGPNDKSGIHEGVRLEHIGLIQQCEEVHDVRGCSQVHQQERGELLTGHLPLGHQPPAEDDHHQQRLLQRHRPRLHCHRHGHHAGRLGVEMKQSIAE